MLAVFVCIFQIKFQAFFLQKVKRSQWIHWNWWIHSKAFIHLIGNVDAIWHQVCKKVLFCMNSPVQKAALMRNSIDFFVKFKIDLNIIPTIDAFFIEMTLCQLKRNLLSNNAIACTVWLYLFTVDVVSNCTPIQLNAK